MADDRIGSLFETRLFYFINKNVVFSDRFLIAVMNQSLNRFPTISLQLQPGAQLEKCECDMTSSYVLSWEAFKEIYNNLQ